MSCRIMAFFAFVLLTTAFAADANQQLVDCSDVPEGATVADACLRKALTLDGAATLAVPGLAQAREAAFLALARCTADRASDSSAQRSEHMREVKLLDGTIRRSFGSRTVPAGNTTGVSGCSDLEEAATAMRTLVEAAAARLLRALEVLRRDPAGTIGGKHASLLEFARAGEQLEHFHAYRATAGEALDAAAAADPATEDADSDAVAAWAAAPAARYLARTAATGPASTAPASTPKPSHDGEMALPMHTDAGLFIAIVPALHAIEASVHTSGEASGTRPTGRAVAHSPEPDRSAGAADGFVVKLHDGSLARVSAAAADSSVLFLIGSAWSEWLGPHMATNLRAAPHSLTVPSSRRGADSGAVRATAEGRGAQRRVRLWYGRMYLPPADAVLPAPPTFAVGAAVAAAAAVAAGHREEPAHPNGVSYADVRRDQITQALVHHTYASQGMAMGGGNRSDASASVGSERNAPLGHGGSGRSGGSVRQSVRLLDSAGCQDNQIWCWMQCMDTSAFPCGSQVFCENEATGEAWDGATHCGRCRPHCPDSPPPSPSPLPPGKHFSPDAPHPPSSPPRFCNGLGVAMHMQGFAFGSTECLVYLFDVRGADFPHQRSRPDPVACMPRPP